MCCAGVSCVTRRYAVTRYTQAVQSRGTQWPIKFNGMLVCARVSVLLRLFDFSEGMAFVAAMGNDGEADTR